MALYLSRLGRLSYRSRRLVLAVWVALFALVGVGAATLSGPTSDNFSIPGTESQEAFDLLAERFPGAAAGGATARVVFRAPDGSTLADPASTAVVDETVAALARGPEALDATDPFTTGAVSPDGRTAYSSVSYGVQAAELPDAARTAIESAVEEARASGLTVEVGGDALLEEPEQGLAEVLGIGVAAVVLALTFGSLAAAGLPLLTALVGVGIGIAGITAATGFLDLSSSAPALALMLGLAVAIDYALFIVSRVRTELLAGLEPEEAVARALGTAGSAVVFAGLTVVIALAGLSVVGIPFLTAMGLAAAATVAVSVVIALTLLPALLGFAGPRVLRAKDRAALAATPRGAAVAGAPDARPAMAERWGAMVTRRPAAVLVVALLGLTVLAVPALSLETGLPDESTAAEDTTGRQAYELLSAGFGPGFNGPLTIVVDATGAGDPEAAFARVGETASALEGVAFVSPPFLNATGDTALLTVIPVDGPSSQGTSDLVAALRGASSGLADATGAELAVTGQTAVAIDVTDTLSAALLPYLLVVVGLALVLLLLVFRSILVPLTATVGFLFTIAATFGAVVAVFQWGWFSGLLGVAEPGPIMSLLPIFMVGIVFGLAMDYQVFLVTRMREAHVHGATTTGSVVAGFRHSGRVVTAAAIIMVSVFSGFVLAPDPIIKSIGFALAAGVLLDAFVVRMTVIPAVMTLLGERAWWIPAGLDRVLPDVDVEGARLTTLDDLDPRLDEQLEPTR